MKDKKINNIEYVLVGDYYMANIVVSVLMWLPELFKNCI